LGKRIQKGNANVKTCQFDVKNIQIKNFVSYLYKIKDYRQNCITNLSNILGER
jgi:hypothetical protein